MFKLTIGNRIWCACAFLGATTIALAVTAFVTVNRIHEAAKVVADQALPNTYLSGRLNSGAKAILMRMNLHMQSESPQKQAQFQKYLVDRAKQWKEEAKNCEAHANTEKERAMIVSASKDLEALLQTWDRILPLSTEHRHREAYGLYEEEAMAAADRLDETMKSLVSLNKQVGEEAAASASETAARAKAWAIGVLVIALIAGTALVFRIVSGVNRSLRHTVRSLTDSTRQVAAAAAQIAEASQGLALGASEQAASLEETSASGEQINAVAQRNADHSKAAAQLVNQSREGFGQANESLTAMVQAMDEINESSGRISKINKVIDEIAFQTNILALNAAVEAARAGEAGMGFAVVADEVRNLAQRSATAAKDTAALIEESIARSSAGKNRVMCTAESIRAITSSAAQIGTLVDEVASASHEQARGMEQISRAIVQMEKLTQQTAAHSEESAAAAEELNAQSTNLQGIVDELHSLIERA
jgi:methyl-accepting chemotaxis protein